MNEWTSITEASPKDSCVIKFTTVENRYVGSRLYEFNDELRAVHIGKFGGGKVFRLDDNRIFADVSDIAWWAYLDLTPPDAK